MRQELLKAHPVSKGPFGRFLEDGTPYVSPSQVNLVRKCPYKWHARYIRGLPDPSGFEAVRGTLGHLYVEHLHSSAELPARGQLVREMERDLSLLADVNGRVEDAVPLADATLNGLYYLRERKWEIHALEMEVIRRTESHGVRHAVKMRIDALATISGLPNIADWKFPGRTPDPAWGPREDYVNATHMYRWGTEGLANNTGAETGRIVNFPLDGGPVTEFKVDLQASIRRGKELIDEGVAIILGGKFPALPENTYKCDARWCSLRKTCPGWSCG
jgi:hypothetical protein